LVNAHIRLYFDGECLAGIVLDDVQETCPWYLGTIIEGPAMRDWREFVVALHAADLEFDYCPHHPEEGPYEETDLAEYVDTLTALRRDQLRGTSVRSVGDEPWLVSLTTTDPEWLERYLQFLDFRRWRAVTLSGETVESIPLPPSLDLTSKRFAFRP
jgi:hypothetical protein